jgi:hypothetical protein
MPVPPAPVLNPTPIMAPAPASVSASPTTPSQVTSVYVGKIPVGIEDDFVKKIFEVSYHFLGY